MFEHGWFQIAFERELTDSVTPLVFGTKALMAIKTERSEIRVYDATCPHRGASLACGGVPRNKFIRCPFHHLNIGLGVHQGNELWVKEYRTVVRGGLVFICLSDHAVPDVVPILDELLEECDVIPGFTMDVATPLEIISENGWDSAHFKSVHKLPLQPDFTHREGEYGELITEGDFILPEAAWASGDKNGGPAVTRFRSRCFSPGLVIARLQGTPPFNYHIITAASPQRDVKRSTIRLTLCLPKSQAYDEGFVESLLAVSRDGLEDDRRIWEQIDINARSHLQPGETDKLFGVFYEYCLKFGMPTDRRLAPELE